MIYGEKERRIFADSRKCWLCEAPFLPADLFHNLSGYDENLFVKDLGVEEGNINCLPKNEEKYISFTKEVLVDSFTKEVDGRTKDIKIKRDQSFIDSFKFMATS